jgi:hypothetical protein
MIDTVVIRIHNLSHYPQLQNQYYAPAQRKGSQTRALINLETAEYIRENHFTPAVVFHDSNRILTPVYRDTINIPSSHYDLAYSINTEKDYMEFNFSIPKYKYSTNVIQFINEHDQSSDACYNMFFMFITEFLKTKMVQTPALSDVEINRIDFCYNQMFNSESDALTYLEEQKKLMKQFARAEGNTIVPYATSFYYKTRRYMWKIYHKGSEFKKHDLKELLKKNPLKHDINYLQTQANKMLRYELSIKSSQMQYWFVQYFHASKVKTGRSIYSDHVNIKYWTQLINLGYASVYENYRKTSKYFTLTSVYQDLSIMEFSKHMKDHNNFKGDRGQKSYNYLDTVKFDKTFFQICYKEFWNHVHKYQIAHVVDLAHVKKRISEINKDKKNRKTLKIANDKDLRSMDETKMLMLACLIKTGGKFNDLKDYLPQRTFYRLQSEMKLLGLHDNTAEIAIPTPKTDFVEYRIFMRQFHKY